MRQPTEIAILILLPASLFPPSLPAQSQSKGESPECKAALKTAQARIKKSRNVKIEKMAKVDISALYDGYPEGRPSGYGFRLNGAGAASVMESEQLLGSISKGVIKSCPSVSVVEFNLSQTDWSLTFGVLEGGNVEAFHCITPKGRDSNKIPWGKTVCL